MSVTLETSQLVKSWLKTSASLNMAFMFVTLAVFQLESGWLKSRAS